MGCTVKCFSSGVSADVHVCACVAASAPAAANPQDDAAAAALMQSFGAIVGAIAQANRPPSVVYVPQPYPVYVAPPVCWQETHEVWTDWGPVPRTMQFCR